MLRCRAAAERCSMRGGSIPFSSTIANPFRPEQFAVGFRRFQPCGRETKNRAVVSADAALCHGRGRELAAERLSISTGRRSARERAVLVDRVRISVHAGTRAAPQGDS